MRRDQDMALSRLVRLIARRHAGTMQPDDRMTLGRLQATLGYDDAVFDGLCSEIVATLDAGWVWNSRYRKWRDSGERAPVGRPRQRHFVTAWQLARVELLTTLRREPVAEEVAHHLRSSAFLRQLAGVERWARADTLARRARRMRNFVHPVC